MRINCKPVRRCHKCPLNLGSHCWVYKYPRGQWRGGKGCRAFGDERLYGEFDKWKKQPNVKTRKELRREFFRSARKSEEHHNHFGSGLL